MRRDQQRDDAAEARQGSPPSGLASMDGLDAFAGEMRFDPLSKFPDALVTPAAR